MFQFILFRHIIKSSQKDLPKKSITKKIIFLLTLVAAKDHREVACTTKRCG
jgi:hypothetical protein